LHPIGLSFAPTTQKMKDFVLIPYVSIKPRCISVYCRVENYVSNRTRKQFENEVNLEDNDPAGILSMKASKRIGLAIDWLLFIATNKKIFSKKLGKYFQFKINFVTLTLSSNQVHPDNEIKSKLLNQFITEARKKWGVKNYLWRAEPQRNGNIHFHVVTDKFIPWDELRETWNRIQNKLGYVDRYAKTQREKFKNGFVFDPKYGMHWNYDKQLKAYKKSVKEDWNNPNSTDVHSIKKIRNIGAYLAKYCTKQPKGRKIEGDLWRLSQGLSKLKSVIWERDSIIEHELALIKEAFKNKTKIYDYCTCFYVDVKDWYSLTQGSLWEILKKYVNHVQTA